jgi:hypothetical protein
MRSLEIDVLDDNHSNNLGIGKTVSDFNAMDLDSLDALLDAAEIEAAPESEPSVDPPKEENKETIQPEVTLPPTEAPTPEPVVTPLPTPEIQAETRNEPVVKRTLNNKKQPANSETWTEAEMDSVKKLIIIFGSVTIVLILSAIGIGLGGLLSDSKTDPKLIESVEAIKNDVGQSYLVTEDSGKQLKKMQDSLGDAVAQINQLFEIIDGLKTAPVVAHAAPTRSTSSSDRKAAMREEQSSSLNEDADSAEPTDTIVDRGTTNSPQVKALSVDIQDVKSRLIVTNKLLVQINKQSESLIMQSDVLTKAVQAVEDEMKSNKPQPKVVTNATPKVIVDKKAEEKPVAPVQVKPADDPQFRARWSREMGKSEGFP